MSNPLKPNVAKLSGDPWLTTLLVLFVIGLIVGCIETATRASGMGV